MKVRGFTLIELLAVIVILGIILGIAVPSVLRIIEKTQIDAFVESSEMMKDATIKYLTANETLYPNNIGDTKEITLSELQNSNFISNISDPKGGNNCGGYVLVTKIGENNYDFSPTLKCDSNYYADNSNNDGLVGYWKFDDYGEPTENLFIQNTPPHSIHPDWSLVKIGDKLYKLEALRDAPGTYEWNFVGNITNVVVVPANQVVTMSCEIVERNTTLISPYMQGFGTLNSKFNNRVYRTRSYNLQWSHSVVMHVSNPAAIKKGDYIIVKQPQLEYKSYPTPFVDGVRNGIISDYSMTNNDANLDLITTPRWVSSGTNDSGAYEFNGTDDHIVLPNDIVPVSTIRTQGVTYSAWIKPSSLTAQRIVGQQISVGYSDYSSGGLGISSNGEARMIAYSDANPSSYVYADSNTILEVGNWYHIVGTYDPKIVNLEYMLMAS